MKAIPQIQKLMTPMPHMVGKDIPLKTALGMMREHRIRHLPVLDGGKLIGVLTDRDVKLASSFQHSSEFVVEEVMTPDPYTIVPEAPADQVVAHMAEHKLGCAIIQQSNGKVVGIFTATDGLRVLSDQFHQHYKS